MMTAQEKYEYWLDVAQYDLDSADAMFTGGRWMYVMVMCQQAVEKLAKGLYLLYIDDNIPRIHNIRKLVELFEDKLPVKVPQDTFDFFDTLTQYYLGNRYPEYVSKMGARANEFVASNTLVRTKEVFSWLLTLKP